MSDETAIVQEYAEKADALVHRSQSLVIHNQEERELVATVALEARFIDDEAEVREKEITKPLNEALKKVRELFKDGVRTKCSTAQGIADGLLKKDFIDFEDARVSAQEVINASKDQSGGFIPDVILPPTEKTIVTSNGKITLRKDIEVAVDDLDKVLESVIGVHMDCPHCKKEIVVNRTLPRILVNVDLGAAKRYAKSAGLKEIPGFIIKDTVVVTGRK